MVVNKIGMAHLEIGKNCQDYGVETERTKIVCDGCSAGKHTEVGAKAYCYLASRGLGTKQIFKQLVPIFGHTNASIKNFLCFTILKVTETEKTFQFSCYGDGYVIVLDKEGTISFEEFTDGEYPGYYAYYYCSKDSLNKYKEGVKPKIKIYEKALYQKVGVASDGIRYILREEKLKQELIELLKLQNIGKIKRFINRNQKYCKDDITIVF
ncbi:MAG: hypothetical protein HFG39_04025 [Lachnospiraceae bacterium]|nr:hypothetical protein [Lachnospiraceae bacterium]